MAKKKEAAGKAQASRRKVQIAAEVLIEAAEQNEIEVSYLFKEGDNLEKVAHFLTGKHHMYFKVCDYSGVNPCDVKPGTVLKWRW